MAAEYIVCLTFTTSAATSAANQDEPPARSVIAVSCAAPPKINAELDQPTKS